MKQIIKSMVCRRSSIICKCKHLHKTFTGNS